MLKLFSFFTWSSEIRVTSSQEISSEPYLERVCLFVWFLCFCQALTFFIDMYMLTLAMLKPTTLLRYNKLMPAHWAALRSFQSASILHVRLEDLCTFHMLIICRVFCEADHLKWVIISTTYLMLIQYMIFILITQWCCIILHKIQVSVELYISLHNSFGST